MVLEAATRALRENSGDVLAEGLSRLLDVARGGSRDERDLMVGLAVFFDCARRLELAPVDVFDRASEGRPSELADTLRTFAHRTDITPEAFGFVLEEGPGGAQYRWS